MQTDEVQIVVVSPKKYTKQDVVRQNSAPRRENRRDPKMRKTPEHRKGSACRMMKSRSHWQLEAWERIERAKPKG